MASSLLAKLVLVTTLITLSVISRANEDLIMKQCHNSNNPTWCLRCLNSDTTSPEADQVGLALIILRCINSHLLTLTKKASSLALKHHRNLMAVAAFNQCGLDYARANRGLGEVEGHLIAGDYDKAAYDVSNIVIAPQVSCRTSLTRVKVNLPASFRYHTEVYLALTQDLLRIVDRL